MKQKSVQKVEKKIKKQLKKQKLGLPISSFSFLSNFSHDEKEKNLDTLSSDNLKEGKKDFADLVIITRLHLSELHQKQGCKYYEKQK